MDSSKELQRVSTTCPFKVDSVVTNPRIKRQRLSDPASSSVPYTTLDSVEKNNTGTSANPLEKLVLLQLPNKKSLMHLPQAVMADPLAKGSFGKLIIVNRMLETLTKFSTFGTLTFGPSGVALIHTGKGFVNLVLHKQFFEGSYDCPVHVDFHCDLSELNSVLRNLRQNNCIRSGGRVTFELHPDHLVLIGVNNLLLEETRQFIRRQPVTERDLCEGAAMAPPSEAFYHQSIKLPLSRLGIAITNARSRNCDRVVLEADRKASKFWVRGISNNEGQIVCSTELEGISVNSEDSSEAIGDDLEEAVLTGRAPRDYHGVFQVAHLLPMCQSKIRHVIRLLVAQDRDLIMDIFIDVYTDPDDPDRNSKSSYLRHWVKPVIEEP
jgi:hypothetical protein